jgi:RNA polymerase sigma-70 factor (ECF subfamily)
MREDGRLELRLRFVGKKGAARMGIWHKIEPCMDSCIPHASTAPGCAPDRPGYDSGYDAADEALLLSADVVAKAGVAEAGERRAGSPSELTIEARDRILELYDEFRPKLFRYLRSLRLGRDQVDEVIQETFMRLTVQLVKETEIQNIRGWIVRVAHNIALSSRKKERRSIIPGDSVAFAIENRPDHALSPEQAYSIEEQFKHMNAVLSRLKPQHSQCFQMRAQGLRYKDIGQALGMSEQRVAFLVKQVAAQLSALCG